VTISNSQSGTRIDEISRGIYRISTPVPKNPAMPTGFSFNQFLVLGDAPLLFHTGPKSLFGLVVEAVRTVARPEALRYVGFSHTEGDECGSICEWLELAPEAQPLCSRVAAMTFANDLGPRPVRAMADGERLDLGGHQVTWFDTPHVPHGWDCGYLGETSTKTLLCGDLFTQAGNEHAPLTEQDILGPSEGMRQAMDYYAHAPSTRATLERLAAFEPRVLACMHGASFSGDGRAVLRDLASALSPSSAPSR
jgi:flavorubredoxin